MAIKPDSVILTETINRIDNYKVALRELITINNELARATLAVTKSSNNKTLAKNEKALEIITKKRTAALRTLNIEAKKNNDIKNYAIKSNVNLKKTINNATAASKKATAEYRKNTSALKAQQKQIQKNKNSTKRFVSWLKQVGIASLAFLGIRKLGDIAKNLFDTVKKLDSLHFTMQTVIKDMDEIRITEAFLIDISNKYGAEIITLTERYVKFRAAAIQSNMTLRDTQQIYKSVVKAAGVMGLGADDLQSALLALEQMISKGKITTEELRRQLGEKMPGAMGIMAKAVDVLNPELEVTVDVLDGMMRKGQVISAEVLPEFARQLEKAYSIEKVEMVDTLAAAQIRNKNAWTEFIAAIEEGDGVISKTLKTLFDGISKIAMLLTPANVRAIRADAANEYFKDIYDEAEEAAKKLNLTLKEYGEKNIKDAEGFVDRDMKIYLDKLTELNATKKEFYSMGWLERSNSDIARKATIPVLEEQLKIAASELGASEGLLKAYKDMAGKLNGDGDRDGDKTKIIKSRNLSLKEYNTYQENMINLMKEEMSLWKTISKDKNKSYNEQIEALENIELLKKSLNDIDKENKLKKLDESYKSSNTSLINKEKIQNDIIVKKKANKQSYDTELENINKIHKAKIALLNQYNYYKETIINKHGILEREIDIKTAEEKIKLNIKSIEKNNNIRVNKIDIEEARELAAQNELFNQKLLSQKQFEINKTNIAKKYLKRRIQSEITGLIKLREVYRDLDDDENVSNISKAIAKLQLQLKELDNTDIDKLKASFKEFLVELQSLIADLVSEIGNLVNQAYENNIISLEDRLVELNNYYQEQYDLAEGDKKQQEEIREFEKKERLKLDNEIRKQKRNQAEADKAFKLFEVTINTPSAIMKAAPDPILMGLTAAIGLAQSLKILNTKIPKYKYGTENHIGGLGIIGDGGEKEVVVEPSGYTYVSDDKPTLVDMPKGTAIYSSVDKYLKNRFIQTTTIDKSINKQPVIVNDNSDVVNAINNIKTNVILKQNFEYLINKQNRENW